MGLHVPEPGTDLGFRVTVPEPEGGPVLKPKRLRSVWHVARIPLGAAATVAALILPAGAAEAQVLSISPRIVWMDSYLDVHRSMQNFEDFTRDRHNVAAAES